MSGAREQDGLDQAMQLAAHGRHEEAETKFEALVEAAPDLAAAWLELGKTRLARGKPREAFEAFGHAAGYLDTAAEARSRLGRLARPGPGDHLRERNFKIALLVDPRHCLALADLADLRAGPMLVRFALAFISTVAETDPFRELLNRGWIERALRLAKIASILAPDQAPRQRDLATMLFRLEDFDGNARHLKRAAVGAPGDLNAQIEAVDALFRIEEMDLAEIYADRAVATGGATAPGLFWLGRVQRRLGRFEAARATFAETLGADSDFGLRVNVVEQGIHPGDFEP